MRSAWRSALVAAYPYERSDGGPVQCGHGHFRHMVAGISDPTLDRIETLAVEDNLALQQMDARVGRVRAALCIEGVAGD